MEATQYQNEFGRSLAPVFFPDNVSPLHVSALFNGTIRLAQLADGMKRGLFYNKMDRLPDPEGYKNDVGLPYNVDTDIVHALLGMIGELGEIVEILIGNDDLERGRARLVDENGDFIWYQALLFSKFGITYQEAFAGNIEKLKKRYPDKFTTELAVNRDLEAEAKVFDDRRITNAKITSGVISADQIVDGSITSHTTIH